ncbi:hypothetical protein GALL_196460 [mine drainage metagenome]|uniref:Uncharacterized protein n=1 Tax=mine drainage metagenome TaxID=410659 RepID=A0A1J5RQ02_9ZZZZ
MSAAPPVFLHSGFRTSSTWLWSRFRLLPGTCCFNEIYNEELRDLTAARAQGWSYDGWESHHPETAPYFLEFLPLLRPGGGVMGYDIAMSLPGFLPEGGLNGPLPDGEAVYLQGLLALAAGRGRQAVLSSTRSLGRMAAMRKALGGVHLFLYRDLWRQWASFSWQQGNGNAYFVQALITLIAQDGPDSFFRLLRLYMASHCGRVVGAWDAPEHNDALFIVFCGLHLYLSMAARRAAHLCLDASRLAADAAYAAAMEAEIGRLSGLPVDLSGAVSRCQQPARPLLRPEQAWRQADLLLRAALSVLKADDDTAAFGAALLRQAQESFSASSAGLAG